jgi:ZIP family zinc transporter
VYYESLVDIASKKVLGGGLALSAGVMIYVSFVEIYIKGVDAFLEEGYSESEAKSFTTLFFFLGFGAMYGLDLCVHKLYPEHQCLQDLESTKTKRLDAVSKADSVECKALSPVDVNVKLADTDKVIAGTVELTGGLVGRAAAAAGASTAEVAVASENDQLFKGDVPQNEDSDLHRMGLLTALAIGLHNLPEGLATFVAAVDDPSLGAALAVAIAIHNIPEGICVTIPIYYSTGNRNKAFLWAFLSGLSELVGAAIGWALLSVFVSGFIYGALFGLVAGMMIYISFYELLPTAYRYDPEGKVTSVCLLIGMVIMALSLILFLF